MRAFLRAPPWPIVVALVAVSAAPVYLRSLEKAGVKHRLDVLTPSRTAFHVNTSWIPLERPEFHESDATVDAARDDHVADVVVGQTRFVKSRAHLWNFEGLPPREDITDSRSFFHLISDLDQQVDYIEGRPPSPEVTYENGDGRGRGCRLCAPCSHAERQGGRRDRQRR